MGNRFRTLGVSKEWTLPLGREAFEPGFEEHRLTEGKNSAPDISIDFEQGLSSQTPTNILSQTLGDMGQPSASSPERDMKQER